MLNDFGTRMVLAYDGLGKRIFNDLFEHNNVCMYVKLFFENL